jgi:rRNA maturation endonuclease Nob1
MPLQPDPADESPLFECLDCQKRVEDPEGRLCGECGGYLQNIGVPRHR